MNGLSVKYVLSHNMSLTHLLYLTFDTIHLIRLPIECANVICVLCPPSRVLVNCNCFMVSSNEQKTLMKITNDMCCLLDHCYLDYSSPRDS